MKYCSIDIETTGLIVDECDIVEFGAVLDDICGMLTPERLSELPVFHCYFKKEYYQGSPYALSMHPKIFRRIAEKEEGYNYYNAEKFGYQFKKFLLANGYEEEDGRVYINAAGKNFGAFDLQFLDRKTDLNKHVKIRHRILDPGSMYMVVDDEVVPGTEECLRRANLDPNVTHKAVDDAFDVVKLIRYKFGQSIKVCP